MRTLPAQLLAAVRALLVFTLLLGIGYPLLVLAIGQGAFRENANGSEVEVDGRVVGSDLIGQSFTDAAGTPLARYFQSRPSAAGAGYDPTATGASNRGPEDTDDMADDSAPGDTSRTSLLSQICARSRDVGTANGVSGTRAHCTAAGAGDPTARARAAAPAAVPPDAVTASASGLDPHISPAYARLQVARVARVRGLPVERVAALVERYEQGRTLGFLGEPRVNVVRLNLALDRLG